MTLVTGHAMRLGTPAAWLLRKEGLNMEHITKCKCYIHSLKDGDGKPQLAEAAILEKTGDNAYTAEYNGIRCTAIFNPFVGHFYVDDIYGVLPEEKPAEAGPDSQTNLDHCARRPFEVTITEILKLTVNVEAGSGGQGFRRLASPQARPHRRQFRRGKVQGRPLGGQEGTARAESRHGMSGPFPDADICRKNVV